MLKHDSSEKSVKVVFVFLIRICTFYNKINIIHVVLSFLFFTPVTKLNGKMLQRAVTEDCYNNVVSHQ